MLEVSKEVGTACVGLKSRRGTAGYPFISESRGWEKNPTRQDHAQSTTIT